MPTDRQLLSTRYPSKTYIHPLLLYVSVSPLVVFSESRIDGRTAYQRETRALLGIVEIFHRIGRRTRCTVARFIYTFSLCTWSFWKYWYFKMYLKDVIFIRNYSWFLTNYFFNFDNKNNNCYIIEITNREKNFPYNIPFHVCTLYVFF